MSIKLRLNLALAVVLVLAAISVMAALLFDAGPRLRNEIASSLRVTEAAVRASIGSIEHSPHPEAALGALVMGMSHQRHVRIRHAARLPERGNILTLERQQRSGLRSWISEEEGKVIRVPVVARGRDLGTILVVADGSDEMREVLETIGSVMAYTGLFALGAFFVTSHLIGRSLAPIEQLHAAMKHLEDGDYDVALPSLGPPEIAGMCARLNTLAKALSRTRKENQRLARSMVEIQDDERRDLARELHDELGPYLFSLRASGAALNTQIERGILQPERIKHDVGSMIRQAEAIQFMNRRVLQRLAPAGLHELGLSRALGAVADGWRREQPATDLSLDIAGDIDEFDDTTTLTIYRVVQEGLTNAFRHAGASRIAVNVSRTWPNDSGKNSDDEPGAIAISIRDDGDGVTDETEDGFGLRGMRDRVSALGGTIRLVRGESGGTSIEALIPSKLERRVEYSDTTSDVSINNSTRCIIGATL